MRPLLAWPIVLFLACNSANAQQWSPHARRAVEIIQQLRAIPIPNSDELEAGPPANVPGLLRQLNQELKALIIADLNDGTKHAVPDEEEILEQLRAAGIGRRHAGNQQSKVEKVPSVHRDGLHFGL